MDGVAAKNKRALVCEGLTWVMHNDDLGDENGSFFCEGLRYVNAV